MHLMKVIFRFLPILVLTCAAVVQATAQTVNVSVTGAEGIIVKTNDQAKWYIGNKDKLQFYGIYAGWRARGDSVKIIDDLWGRPEVGAGLLIGDYSHIPLHSDTHDGAPAYNSNIGQMITLYGMFRRDLVRTSHWSAGYKMENGLGICTHPYNLEDNIQNCFLGAPLSVFVGMGFYAQYHPTPRWSVGVDAGFRHYSNGRLAQPNAGINSVDVGLRVGYALRPDTMVRNPLRHAKDTTWRRHLYADFSAAWSPQTIYTQYSSDFRYPAEQRRSHYKLYNGWTLRGAMMYHYRRKFASGIAIDYTYAPYIDDIRTADIDLGKTDGKYNKNILGIALAHEAFWHDFSIHMSLGYYLIHDQGTIVKEYEKPYFETVGLRYYLPVLNRRLYIGYDIKASAVRATCMQFAVGYCPWKRH